MALTDSNTASARTGSWGGADRRHPEAVTRAMEQLRSGMATHDWAMFAADGSMWLVARLYDDEKSGAIIAARVIIDEGWNDRQRGA